MKEFNNYEPEKSPTVLLEVFNTRPDRRQILRLNWAVETETNTWICTDVPITVKKLDFGSITKK